MIIIDHLTEVVAGTAQMLSARPSQSQSQRGFKIGLKEREALARIDAGTYGLSEVSGKPIPLDRLEAVPSATTLVNEESG